MGSEVNGRPRVVFLDHSGQEGGGQLGLRRYLEHPSRFERSAIFLSGGPVVNAVRRAGIDVRLLAEKSTFDRRDLVRLAPRLAYAIRQTRPDLVIANSGYSAVSLSLVPRRGPARVYYLRTEMVAADTKPVKRFLDEKFVYRRFDAYLGNSRWTLGTIPKSLAERPSAVAYPLSGLPLDITDIPPRQYEGQARPVRFVTLSRLDRWKGIDLVVEALRAVRDLHPARQVTLDVYGGETFAERSYVESLRAAAKRASFPVQFHGHVDDIATPLRTADVLVVPSRSPEPFGQVIAQGLSAGCVVIASRQGGALEQVKHDDNGLTFEPNSVSDLAVVIERLMTEPDLGPRLADRARRSVIEMDDGTMSANFERAIEALLLRTHDRRSAARR